MRLKKCLKCGKLFNTPKNEQALCDDCIAAARSTTIRQRTCRECGSLFDGGPRAWYCSTCRAAREKERAAKYRKNGAARHLGDLDRCEACGQDYVVTSGLQKYCPACAVEVVREKDREASKRWNAENHYYERRTQTQRSGQKICVICGKPVPPGSPRVTCSAECDKLRKQRIRADVDMRRGRRVSPSEIKRLDDVLPPAIPQTAEAAPMEPIEITPELISKLADDLRSIIKRCPDCGEPYVRRSGAAKACRICAAKRQRAQARRNNVMRYYDNIDKSRAQRREYYASRKAAERNGSTQKDKDVP